MSHVEHVGGGLYGYLFLSCTATILEFLSESRFQCLAMVQMSKETGTTTGRRIAMLEHLERLVSTVQSLKHRSSTTLPRKARLDCICDITIDVAQRLLCSGQLQNLYEIHCGIYLKGVTST